MSRMFRGTLEEIEEFERKLAKKLVHVAEKKYEWRVRREVAVLTLKHLARLARECEDRKEDKMLGRIGRPM